MNWKSILLSLAIAFTFASCRQETVSSPSNDVTIVSIVDTAKPLFLFHPPFNRFDTNYRAAAAPNSLITECRYYRTYRDSFRVYWPHLVPMMDSVYQPTVPSAWMKSKSPYWEEFDSIPERMLIHVDTVNLTEYVADPFGVYPDPVTPKFYIRNYFNGPFGRYPYMRDTVMGYFIKFPVLIVPNRSWSRGYVNLSHCRIEVLELRLNLWQALHEYYTRNFNLYVVRGFDPRYNINVYRDQREKPFPYFLTRF